MTRLMLVHGARKDRVNSVGRNAAQMAAFVGMCDSSCGNLYTSTVQTLYKHLVQG